MNTSDLKLHNKVYLLHNWDHTRDCACVPAYPSLDKECKRLFGHSFEKLLSPSRRQELVDARQYFSLKLRDKGYSYLTIGKIMKRDHTTIMHLVKRTKNRTP